MAGKSYLYLICENCKQVAARFDPKDVRVPVNGAMFESQFAERGVLPPWMPFVESEFMVCPRCPKRVFNEPVPLHLTVSDTPDGLNPYFLDLDVGNATKGDTDGGDQHPDSP